jgi:hypothetical protein
MSSKSKNTKQNKKQNESSVDLYKELDDAKLANMLQEYDMIRFIDSNHAYSWNEETFVWTPINSKQQINTIVCEILAPIIEKRQEALWKAYYNCKPDDFSNKDAIYRALKNNKSIGSATKVTNIISMAGKSVVSKDFLNTKIMNNLLPIRNGYCLDIVSLKKRNERKTTTLPLKLIMIWVTILKRLKPFSKNTVQIKTMILIITLLIF